jgi:hypothetical protein
VELPLDMQEVFFETMLGEKSVADFEQWVYSEEQLEKLLPIEDYLELISYGYKAEPPMRHALYQFLEKYIDKGAFEKYRILRMLYRALKHDEKMPEILISTYNLYCKGYWFLQNLGLHYGLNLDFPYGFGNSWDECNEEQKNILISELSPDLDDELRKAIYLLESGAVVPTGERDQYDHFKYVDKRSENLNR